MTRVGGPDGQLAGRLRGAVDVERTDRRVGAEGLIAGAVEHIIGRNLDDRDAEPGRCLGQHSRCQRIDAPGVGNLGLRPVDGGIGGGVDHGGKATLGHEAGGGGGIAEIKLGAVDAESLVALRPGETAEGSAELSGRAGDQDALHGADLASPRRLSASVRARISCHHGLLARYQAMVFSMPVSKLSRGAQPSSRRILAESMA